MASRRSYLALVAGGLSSLAGCGTPRLTGGGPATSQRTETAPRGDPPSPPDQASEIVPESSFDRVIDVVNDAGVDPSGGDPVDDAVDEVIEDNSLLVFPRGSYRFDRLHAITGFDRIGIVGRENARIIPRAESNDKLFEVSDVGEFLLAGFDVDITQTDTTAGLRVACGNRFRIEDIEFVGRGTHPDREVLHALNVGIVNSIGQGVIRNFVAKKGSRIDRYKNGGGRGGIYIGPWNKGTISIEDCHLEEFGNNGIYASRTPGNVEVVGGIFRNNSPSSVRISGRGSRVENALIEVDLSTYTGPEIDTSDFKARGVVIEQKTTDPEIMKPAGAIMRGCTVNFKENPTSGPPVVVWSNGKTLTIEDCDLHVENDTPAVVRDGEHMQGDNPPWEGERWIRLLDTRITGTNVSNMTAVRLTDSPGSEFQRCMIERTGDGCTGIEFFQSPNATISGGSVRSSDYPVVFEVDGDHEGCLVSFVEQPRLEMIGSTGGGDALPLQETVCGPAVDDASLPRNGDSNDCCITWDDLSEHASMETPTIGVSTVNGQGVSFHSLREGT